MPDDTSAVSVAFLEWLKRSGVHLGEISLSTLVVEGGNADADAVNGNGNGDDARPPRLRRRRRTVLATASSDTRCAPARGVAPCLAHARASDSSLVPLDPTRSAASG